MNPKQSYPRSLSGELLMRNTNWKDIAELVGIAAIVGSLIFLGLEMQQTQEIALNETRFNSAGSKIQEYIVRFEHADIWVRGNAGEELDRAEAMIYEGLVRTSWLQSFWDNRSWLQLNITANEPLHDFAWFLFRNPGAREIWESVVEEKNDERRLLLSPMPKPAVEAIETVRADLAKLDQLDD